MSEIVCNSLLQNTALPGNIFVEWKQYSQL